MPVFSRNLSTWDRNSSDVTIPREYRQFPIMQEEKSYWPILMDFSYSDRMKTQDDVRQFIQARSEAKGGKGALAEWSRGIGRNHAYLFQFITKGTPRKLDEDDRKKLASLMDVDEADLMGDREGTATSIVVPKEVIPGPDVDPSDIGARDVPVLGTAMGGTSADERGVDFWLSGDIENHVARPKGLARAANVFCLYIGGDSMEPRFEERDMVFVQKTMPGIGDDVIIELHPPIEGSDHPTFIKRLVRRNQSFITVKQYNPPKELEFSFKEIKNLFRVIPTKELMG